MNSLNDFLKKPEIKHIVPDETLVKLTIMLVIVVILNAFIQRVIGK